jgi:hypothetical protein
MCYQTIPDQSGRESKLFGRDLVAPCQFGFFRSNLDFQHECGSEPIHSITTVQVMPNVTFEELAAPASRAGSERLDLPLMGFEIWRGRRWNAGTPAAKQLRVGRRRADSAARIQVCGRAAVLNDPGPPAFDLGEAEIIRGWLAAPSRAHRPAAQAERRRLSTCRSIGASSRRTPWPARPALGV